jgi:hypothetical protein
VRRQHQSLLLAGILVSLASAAHGQGTLGTQQPPLPSPNAAATLSKTPTPWPVPPTLPSPQSDVAAVNRANTELVVTLIRTTIVGLYQANVSGNYSVLRDIAAPDFQAKNSAADLARIFTNIRDLKIDLGAAVLLDPKISRAELTAEKKLYVVGALETKPAPVTFEMLFQFVAGYWRIYGVSITPVESLANKQNTAALAQSTDKRMLNSKSRTHARIVQQAPTTANPANGVP